PLSLGVNPLLTISALAERNCAQLAQSRGWNIDYNAAGDTAPPPALKIGLRFTETMIGTYYTGDVKPEGQQDDRAEGTPISFTVTVVSD
ncbi:hypothetical protein, partial [Pseudoxanthomonas sp. KAs_5_3]